ncbi:MAG: MmcQ/YjbR family DNA-binding protein [Faecalibacterium sp.]
MRPVCGVGPEVWSPEKTPWEEENINGSQKLEQLIFDTCSVEPDYPWMDTPESAVFRHPGNRKWFALVTTVSRSKLGLPGKQLVDIVNLKCDPLLIGSLRMEPGFYPAYHMNKDNWITAALDGSAPDDTIRMLLEMSYAATAPKLRKKPRPSAACPCHDCVGCAARKK